MAQRHALTKDRPTGPGRGREANTDRQIPREIAETRHQSHLGRHFLEMLAVMAVGMVSSGFILLRIVGLTSWNEATILYPTQCLLVMAAGMSAPMVAWMLYRGMGWKNSYEMAATMVVPVIPFLCLVWFGVTKGAQCGAYCGLTMVAMLALMRYRKSEYSMQM